MLYLNFILIIIVNIFVITNCDNLNQTNTLNQIKNIVNKFCHFAQVSSTEKVTTDPYRIHYLLSINKSTTHLIVSNKRLKDGTYVNELKNTIQNISQFGYANFQLDQWDFGKRNESELARFRMLKHLWPKTKMHFESNDETCDDDPGDDL